MKEKFGTLRFYVDGADSVVYGFIGYTEYLSAHVCEVCGSTEGACTNATGWKTTLCPRCRKARAKA